MIWKEDIIFIGDILGVWRLRDVLSYQTKNQGRGRWRIFFYIGFFAFSGSIYEQEWHGKRVLTVIDVLWLCKLIQERQENFQLGKEFKILCWESFLFLQTMFQQMKVTLTWLTSFPSEQDREGKLFSSFWFLTRILNWNIHLLSFVFLYKEPRRKQKWEKRLTFVNVSFFAGRERERERERENFTSHVKRKQNKFNQQFN